MQDLLSKEEMLDKKLWDVRVIETGGISYFYPEPKLGGENFEIKKRYRVSCTFKDEHTKLLKFKIKTANNEIFSVAAKTMGEGQEVVNQLFGRGHYRVSEQLV